MKKLLAMQGLYLQLCSDESLEEDIFFGPFDEVTFNPAVHLLEAKFMDEFDMGRKARFFLTSDGIPYNTERYRSYRVQTDSDLDNTSWNWRDRVIDYYEQLAHE